MRLFKSRRKLELHNSKRISDLELKVRSNNEIIAVLMKEKFDEVIK